MEHANQARGRRRRAGVRLLGLLLLAVPPRSIAEPPSDPPPPVASPVPETVPAPPAAAPGEAVRKPNGRVRGTVTDAAKQAQPGLLVTLSSHVEPDILRVTGTNEKGQYQFLELPPGVYDLKVLAEGFQDAGKENIEVRPPFQNIVDVRLQSQPATPPSGGGEPAAPGGTPGGQEAPAPAPVTVRGRFVDQDRRPLVEVSVVLSSLQGHGVYQAFSGDEGRFEVPGVPPGRYRVIVRSPGHVPLDLRSVEILGKTGLTVSLMLVDYPLNFKAGQDATTPLEEPRAAPAPRGPDAAAAEGGAPARDDAPAAPPGG